MEQKRSEGNLQEYSRADLIFDFVSLYYERTNLSKDYGTGESHSMTEVHLVTKIADCPGITVTELAQWGCRTKGAVSQVVKRLEAQGLVEKHRAEKNRSRVLLYVTERGRQLSRCHKNYDAEHGGAFDAMLAEKKGQQAVEQFYDVMAYMCSEMRRKREKALGEKCAQCHREAAGQREEKE